MPRGSLEPQQYCRSVSSYCTYPGWCLGLKLCETQDVHAAMEGRAAGLPSGESARRGFEPSANQRPVATTKRRTMALPAWNMIGLSTTAASSVGRDGSLIDLPRGAAGAPRSLLSVEEAAAEDGRSTPRATTRCFSCRPHIALTIRGCLVSLAKRVPSLL